MDNRKDYEKRLGERLEAAYMLEDIGSVMSREEFHELIRAAERKKKHRRTMFGVAAACVALCLIWGGFAVGMNMRENASAGKDDETKTVQQGGSVVIGSGVSENDRNVGVSTKTYTDIEDIPEDIRKEIRFLSSDEFELEKVKVVQGENVHKVEVTYLTERGKQIVIVQTYSYDGEITVIGDCDKKWTYNGVPIYEKTGKDGRWYWIEHQERLYYVKTYDDSIKIETIVDGLKSWVSEVNWGLT